MTSDDELRDGFNLPHQYAFFIEAMLFNTNSALRSANAAFDHLDRIINEEISVQTNKDQLLDSIQNFIIHSGAVSRYFWPSQDSPRKIEGKSQSKNLHKRRGKFFREKFGITENNPLENRALRNSIEHFDERLDLYLEGGIYGHIFPSLILEEPEETDIPHHIFRAYYINEGIFQLLDERYQIQPIFEEIIRIHKILKAR